MIDYSFLSRVSLLFNRKGLSIQIKTPHPYVTRGVRKTHGDFIIPVSEGGNPPLEWAQ